MNIMFTLTKKEYEELIGIISKYCCPCGSKHGHCSEMECDVQMVCEILWEHVDRNDIKSYEEKTAIGWSEGEAEINCDEDKLPFRK